MRADRARDAGQLQLGASFYRLALDREPKNSPIWIQYGHALKEAGNHCDAEAAYRTALFYEPNNADGHLQLAHVLKLQGRIAQAKAAYCRALTIDASVAEAADELRELGEIDAQLTEAMDDAVRDTHTSIMPVNGELSGSSAPTNAKRRKVSLITHADRARDARKWDIAVDLYRKALDHNPKRPNIWIQYGHALKETGRLAEAAGAYSAAIIYDSTSADAHLQLGHLLKLQGKQWEAEAAYLRAFALDPGLPDPPCCLDELGWSAAHIAELQQISGSDSFPPDGALQEVEQRPGASVRNWKVWEHPRERLLERFLDIDIPWVIRRHPGVTASAVTLDDYLQTLAQLGIDFSPLISVRRLRDQFPDYDFSSGKALIVFLEKHADQTPTAALHWLFDELFYRSANDPASAELGSRLEPGYFDFLLNGLAKDFRPHPLFNAHWYRNQLGSATDAPPFIHFLQKKYLRIYPPHLCSIRNFT